MTFPGHLTDCTRQDTQRAVDYITRRESTNFIHLFFFSLAQTSVLKMEKKSRNPPFFLRRFSPVAFVDDFPVSIHQRESPFARGDKPWHQEQLGDPNNFSVGLSVRTMVDFSLLGYMDLSENHDQLQLL